MKARNEWEHHRSLPFAGDFLGAAYALGRSDLAGEAAEFVLNSSFGSRAVQDLAARVLDREARRDEAACEPPRRDEEASRRAIHEIRVELRDFPRNALAYMDLAREYVVMGQHLAARRPVQMALALAPGNRFVLRSASRFFLHIDDRQRAHDILRKAEISAADPWLIAAEIAVARAANRIPTLAKVGRRLVDSGAMAPSHLSELASALGTLELEAGRVRLVRRYLRCALEDPTENAVAQAGWIMRRLDGEELDPRVLATPRSYEAQAWANLTEGRWRSSLEAAELWLRDEPFSSRPAVFGSWVALIAEPDYAMAERVARVGLSVHPQEFTLLNNLVVSLAYMERTGEAAETLDKIDPAGIAEEKRATYLATKGLVAFRQNAPEEGRRWYEAAIATARDVRNQQAMVWALLHLAREESRYDRNAAGKLVERAGINIGRLSKVEQAVARRLQEVILRAFCSSRGR